MSSLSSSKLLEQIFKSGRYTSTGVGYSPHLDDRDKKQISTGVVEIEKVQEGIQYTYSGDIHGFQHVSSVIYLFNGTMKSNSSKGSSRKGTWRIDDNNTLFCTTTGKDDYGHEDSKRIVISRTSNEILITSYVITVDAKGAETIVNLAGTETLKLYMRQFSSSTCCDVKVKKASKKYEYTLELPKKSEVYTVQEFSGVDDGLDADRICFEQTTRKFYYQCIRDSTSSHTLTLRARDGKSKTLMALKGGKIASDGTLLLNAKWLTGLDTKGNRTSDAPKEGTMKGATLMMDVEVQQSFVNKTAIWHVKAPAGLNIQAGASTTEQHNALREYLEKKNAVA